ncbi:hypothetical protein BDA99DRAFT_524484 [Phascolomyces articulosus]|uniref:Uncharacterized protein n=1 Tax=Phascolomyces articulosus TaxID=60185 RepID=A0AAD5JZZ5_9FUNG|nr:hypothetical protein BDA99DRAFT_524484 [Phascolomyces articulosus]
MVIVLVTINNDFNLLIILVKYYHPQQLISSTLFHILLLSHFTITTICYILHH